MIQRLLNRRLLVLAAAAALTVIAPLQAMPAAGAPTPTPTPSYLFTVEAAHGTTTILKPRGTTERMTITLDHVDPVTQFSDRPMRNAKLISPAALTTHWPTWFADSPPNAVMTWSAGEGKAPSSFVVTLTKAAYDPAKRTLTFTAERDPRQHDPAEKGKNWQRQTTPATFTQASLFIDNTGSRVVNGCTIATNASCPGANLSGGNLNYLNVLYNVNLAGANLSKASMIQAVFAYSNFTGADFTGAELSETILAASALDGISSRYGNGPNDVSNSTLTGADLEYSNLHGMFASFADFTGANLAGTDLSYADLSHADFSGANLVGADFTGADIDDTKFYGADLTGAIITGLSFQMTDPSTICPNGLPGYCAPWAPGPDDLPVDVPSGEGDWVCHTDSEFDPYQMKYVPVTNCHPK